MADDVTQLLSPGAISGVSHSLPRRDQPPPRQRRQAPRPAVPPNEDEANPPENEPRTVGSRLNVLA